MRGVKMTDPIQMVSSEINEAAATLESIGFEYGCPFVGTYGTDAASTGHTELSDQLPGFSGFVTEVLNTLTGNLAAIASALRESGQLMCMAEEDAMSQISSVSLPTFNPHTDLN